MKTRRCFVQTTAGTPAFALSSRRVGVDVNDEAPPFHRACRSTGWRRWRAGAPPAFGPVPGSANRPAPNARIGPVRAWPMRPERFGPEHFPFEER
jgi:hypothetical protein